HWLVRLVAGSGNSQRYGEAQHGLRIAGRCHSMGGSAGGTRMIQRARYDVAIVGGGIVGAVLAVALSDANFRVALVEARKPAPTEPGAGYALRQSAVAPGPRRVLHHLGLWEHIPEDRTCVFTGMKIWEA